MKSQLPRKNGGDRKCYIRVIQKNPIESRRTAPIITSNSAIMSIFIRIFPRRYFVQLSGKYTLTTFYSAVIIKKENTKSRGMMI